MNAVSVVKAAERSTCGCESILSCQCELVSCPYVTVKTKLMLSCMNKPCENASRAVMSVLSHKVTKQGPVLPRYVSVLSFFYTDSLLHEHNKQPCACNAQKVSQSWAHCNIYATSIESQQYGTEQNGAKSNGRKLLPWAKLL